jgi:recombination protein RecT
MAEKKEVAKANNNELTMSGYFTSELDRISGALPVDFNKQRFALNFVSLIQDKPELQKYSKEVLATALVRSAQDNLDALNNEVYIYKGYNDKLTYTPSYKGLRKMAIEKSVRPIKDIYAKPIYEKDTVEETFMNGEAKLVYKSNFMNRGKWIGVLAVCVFQDNSEIYELMDMEDINAVKAKSRNSGAWKDFPQEMAKKSVIRRLCKQITLDFSNKQQADMFTGVEESIDDPKEQAAKDISENANKADLDSEEIIDVDVEETVVGEQQSMFEEGVNA